MGRIIDITGQRFGKLTVQYMCQERRNRQTVWHCLCDCGNETDVVSQALRSGHTKSCGCGNYDTRVKEDLVGKQFNRLIVLARQGSDEHRNALWLCECECGNTRIVKTSELNKGDVKECRECAKISMSKGGRDFNKNPYTLEEYLNSSYGQRILNHKFGKLTPIKPIEKRDNAGRVYWECLCDCGNPNPVYVTASSLTSGNTSSCGCLFGKSMGEEKIAKILMENNIFFQRQYTFQDLLSPKNAPLKYDFYIEYNNKKILVEFDGIQHFQPIEYFGGEETFKYLQICDELKNNYAKKHNYKLIRLSYKNINITLEDILGDIYAI